uniref:Cysteine proteinase 1, mitochondrial n=1 Tax=Blastobotrys adeninivorans TaxID=409370 RepID=A0A060TIF4_BLAAD
MSLETTKLTNWTSSLKQDQLSALASSVLRNQDPNKALLNRDAVIRGVNEFQHQVDPEGAPMTNQKSSGRCWIFAATNVFRTLVMKKYNIEKLELSQSFLFFYDKLEKANFFLDQMCQLANEDVDDRLVQHLLKDPVSDGGQFDMIVSLVEKYGLVPQHVFPDAFPATSSSRLNEMVMTLLRQYAQELREAIQAGKDVTELKESQIKNIHRIISLYLGNPPGPNDKFTWEYTDKDKKYHSQTTTPLEFYKDIVGFSGKTAVSLVNDPRNPYKKQIQVSRLGNVVGSRPVTYLNLEVDELARIAVEKIKKNEPVFFGAHTPKYMDNKAGLCDLDVWDYSLVGFKPNQGKADRLRYSESLMTHAMTLTGVTLDDEGKPVRWRVQNSWGEDVGFKGFFIMTQEYFREYVYQIVCDESELGDLKTYLNDKEPVVLPPWDPMGALAD